MTKNEKTPKPVEASDTDVAADSTPTIIAPVAPVAATEPMSAYTGAPAAETVPVAAIVAEKPVRRSRGPLIAIAAGAAVVALLLGGVGGYAIGVATTSARTVSGDFAQGGPGGNGGLGQGGALPGDGRPPHEGQGGPGGDRPAPGDDAQDQNNDDSTQGDDSTTN